MEQVTMAALRRAIETRDGAALAGFYAHDAVLRVIDQNNPPGKPMELKGRDAIAAYYDDVCGRTMTHQVEFGLAEGDRHRVHSGLYLSGRQPRVLRGLAAIGGRSHRAADVRPGLGSLSGALASGRLRLHSVRMNVALRKHGRWSGSWTGRSARS